MDYSVHGINFSMLSHSSLNSSYPKCGEVKNSAAVERDISLVLYVWANLKEVVAHWLSQTTGCMTALT